ncbi:MAG: hypothetical protein M9894_38910 [Planctomycetes bacterium]|nr:hypothetical protein [Planctomycetota bacterium]
MTSLAGRLELTWGELGDRTVWVRTPGGRLLRLDDQGLRALLDLDRGRTVGQVARRYGVAPEEVRGLVDALARGGALRPDGRGRITRTHRTHDEPFAPWLLGLAALLAVHGEYLARHARTAVLESWTEGLVVVGLALVAALLHEGGHWCAARPHFRPRFGLTWLGWLPAAYADTHEAWRLPRGTRLRISAAGVLVDLVVNTGAILVAVACPELERFVTPFVLAQLSRMTLTLNPLVDGDGYWLLADGLGITNLRTQARRRLAERRFDLYALFALLSLALGLLSLVGLGLLLWNVLGNLAGTLL